MWEKSKYIHNIRVSVRVSFNVTSESFFEKFSLSKLRWVCTINLSLIKANKYVHWEKCSLSSLPFIFNFLEEQSNENRGSCFIGSLQVCALLVCYSSLTSTKTNCEITQRNILWEEALHLQPWIDIYIHTSVHVRVSIFSWKDAIEHWRINNFVPAVIQISGLHRGGASKAKYFRFLLSGSGRYSMMKPARSHKESDCRRREGRFRQAVVCTRIKDRKITRRSSWADDADPLPSSVYKLITSEHSCQWAGSMSESW